MTLNEQLQLLSPLEVKSINKITKALSDPQRLLVLQAIMDKELCVCDFIEVTGLSQPAISYHVKILEDAGLIDTRKEGRRIICKINDEHLFQKLRDLIP